MAAIHHPSFVGRCLLSHRFKLVQLVQHAILLQFFQSFQDVHVLFLIDLLLQREWAATSPAFTMARLVGRVAEWALHLLLAVISLVQAVLLTDGRVDVLIVQVGLHLSAVVSESG